jgi:hypothetical protein
MLKMRTDHFQERSVDGMEDVNTKREVEDIRKGETSFDVGYSSKAVCVPMHARMMQLASWQCGLV